MLSVILYWDCHKHRVVYLRYIENFWKHCLRGPFDTCYFEDTIDASNSTVPALNKVFLKNDGTTSILTNLGTTVSITGTISNNSVTSNPTSNSTTFFEDFSSYTDQTHMDINWITTDTAKYRGDPVNDYLTFDARSDLSDKDLTELTKPYSQFG